jgi:hypothetical protein
MSRQLDGIESCVIAQPHLHMATQKAKFNRA